MKLKDCPFCAAECETHQMFPQGSHPWLVHTHHDENCPLGDGLDKRCYKTEDECAASWNGRPVINGVGAYLIADERRRQITVKDFNESYDDCATRGQLAKAAACYAMHAVASDKHRAAIASANIEAVSGWPWDAEWWKPTTRRRDLVKAGALIAAEIDRLARLEATTPEKTT